MAEDAWELLMRFHREVLKPEFDSLRSQIGGMMTKAELDLHIAEIHRRFDRLHSINQEIAASFSRMEEAYQKMLETEAEMKLKHASRH
jgi:hypothetical protein